MAAKPYVLLFRGINVGGNRSVPMRTLRDALTHAGFAGVATYIQSGNVVLTSDQDAAAIAATVDDVFRRTFGFPSQATVRSLDAWRRLVAENPYPEAAAADGRKVHAVLLEGSPAAEALASLRALASTEEIEVRDGALYLHTPDGFGRSKVAESLDRALKVPLTARNWNTVLKLQDMAQRLAD